MSTATTSGTSLADVQAVMAANQAYNNELMIIQSNDKKATAGIDAMRDSGKSIKA